MRDYPSVTFRHDDELERRVDFVVSAAFDLCSHVRPGALACGNGIGNTRP